MYSILLLLNSTWYLLTTSYQPTVYLSIYHVWFVEVPQNLEMSLSQPVEGQVFTFKCTSTAVPTSDYEYGMFIAML